MDSRNDRPNVRYQARALRFLATNQDILVQIDIIRIAAQLFQAPEIDSTNKFLSSRFKLVMGVRIWLRIYTDDEYTIIYEFNRQPNPPLLTIWDILTTD